MRMKSQDSKDKKPDEGRKITLNIPVGRTTEIPRNEIYQEGNPLDIEKLEGSFRKFNLDDDNDSYSSENEEETKELEKNLIAKCPDKIKDQNRQQIRTYTLPYHTTTRIEVSQSRGHITNVTANNYNIETYYDQIPKPVIDYNRSTPAENSLEQIYAELDDLMRRTLDDCLDIAALDTEHWGVNTTGNLIPLPRDSAPCNSPDSSYSSMSPASVPPQSPYFSLHSPNPPIEKTRVSESDSSSNEYELGSVESPFGFVEVNRLQPFINIPPPPRQSQINCCMQPKSQTPVNIQLLTSPRPIHPDSGVIVNEHGLTNTAVHRLTKQNIMKKNCIDQQWAVAVLEVIPLEILKKKEEKGLTPSEKEELKKIRNKLKQNLMCLIKEGPKQNSYFYERLYIRIKLYSREDSDILTAKDENGHTPLYAAAIFQQEYPLIARLIADSLEDFGKLDEEDNTILHYIAKEGDSHAQVLSELLHSRRFDVNYKNIGSKTALHMAVEGHNKKSCLACIKQFVKHGADLKLKDFAGQTALHLAVIIKNGDPLLLKALLQSPSVLNAINSFDNENNTPLHLAAARNDLPLLIQKELVDQLVHSGARHDKRNYRQKTALMLVDADRKEDIRNILQRK